MQSVAETAKHSTKIKKKNEIAKSLPKKFCRLCNFSYYRPV